MDFRRLTRSAAVAADQRSLISARKSTASSVKASEMRLTTAMKISEAEGALERISNTLQVAEMDLGKCNSGLSKQVVCLKDAVTSLFFLLDLRWL